MKEKETPYGKVTLEELREAVEYCFREKPVEDAKKGLGDFIDVYEDKDQLSFSIKTIKKDGKGRHMNIRTGVGGFIKAYDMAPWAMRLMPVKFNGVLLEGEPLEEFWTQFNELKENYDSNKND